MASLRLFELVETRRFIRFSSWRCNASNPIWPFMLKAAFRRVRWDEAIQEVVPESPEEGRMAITSAFELKRGYPPDPFTLSPEYLRNLLENIEAMDDLVLAKAFVREAMNEFRSLRYIQAFYNFYYILEDYYSGGVTSEKETLKRFAASADLLKATMYAMNKFDNMNYHKAAIMRFLKQKRLLWSPKDIYRLLFGLRGDLHHFNRGREYNPTPFDQGRFEKRRVLHHANRDSCDHSP